MDFRTTIENSSRFPDYQRPTDFDEFPITVLSVGRL